MRTKINTVFQFLFFRNFSDLFRFWIWELPQSFLGVLSLVFLWARGRVRNVGVIENVLVVECLGYWGAISFGQIVLGDQSLEIKSENQIFRHEFGHSIQSRRTGILYLIKYGLPSLYSAMSKSKQHNLSSVEKNANRLAHDFFQEKHVQLQWDYDRFPLS